jgi:capsular polysaccharide transport system ATP-binding protein
MAEAPILEVNDLEKIFYTDNAPRRLYHNLSFELGASDRLALLGRNGQGKSTLIRILGDVTRQSHGTVKWSASPSWPMGFGGGFQGALSGLDNIRFIARIYNKPIEKMIDAVEEFAQLGKQLHQEVKYYSTGMRARLTFGISLAIEFDCYLIDEIIAVGDALFRAKCERELFDKRKHKAFIIASHDVDFLKGVCNKAILVDGGYAKKFEDIDLAADIYSSVCEEGRYAGPPLSQYE